MAEIDNSALKDFGQHPFNTTLLQSTVAVHGRISFIQHMGKVRMSARGA